MDRICTICDGHGEVIDLNKYGREIIVSCSNCSGIGVEDVDIQGVISDIMDNPPSLKGVKKPTFAQIEEVIIKDLGELMDTLRK